MHEKKIMVYDRAERSCVRGMTSAAGHYGALLTLQQDTYRCLPVSHCLAYGERLDLTASVRSRKRRESESKERKE